MTKCRCWDQTFLVLLLITAPLTSVADPIHEAAIGGDIDKLKQLIDEGVDVNASDPSGTPLQWALFGNQPEVIRYLLEHGADPNVDGPAGSPLQAAAGMGTTELVQLLLDHGADPSGVRQNKTMNLIMKIRSDSEKVQQISEKATV